MLLNPLQLQESGTESAFGLAETAASRGAGPPFREILFSAQQSLNGSPNRGAPVPAAPEAEPTYPSLAALIAEILAEKSPRPSPGKSPGAPGAPVAQFQDESAGEPLLILPQTSEQGATGFTVSPEAPATPPEATGQTDGKISVLPETPPETAAAVVLPENETQFVPASASSSGSAGNLSETPPAEEETELPAEPARPVSAEIPATPVPAAPVIPQEEAAQPGENAETASPESSRNNPLPETRTNGRTGPSAAPEQPDIAPANRPSIPAPETVTAGAASPLPQNSTGQENDSSAAERQRTNGPPQPANNSPTPETATAGAPSPQPQNTTGQENDSSAAERQRTNGRTGPSAAPERPDIAPTNRSSIPTPETVTAGAPSPQPQKSNGQENETPATETRQRANVPPEPANNNPTPETIAAAGAASVSRTPAGVEFQTAEPGEPAGPQPVQSAPRNAATTGMDPLPKQNVPPSNAGNQPPAPAAEAASTTVSQQQPAAAPETQPAEIRRNPAQQPNTSTLSGTNPPAAPAARERAPAAPASASQTVAAPASPAQQTPEPSTPVPGTVPQNAGATVPQPAPRRNAPSRELPEEAEFQVSEPEAGEEPVRRIAQAREQAEAKADPERPEPQAAHRAEPAPNRPEPAQARTGAPEISAPVRSAQPSSTSGSNSATRPAAPDLTQDPHRVTDQIVRSARMLSRNGTTEVTVRLDPPELGEVTVRLQSRNNILSGEITVENRQVHEVVHGRIADLREALTSQGIHVDRIEVSVDGRGASGPDRDASNNPFSRDSSGRPSPQDNPERQRRAPQWDNRQERRYTSGEGHVDFTA